jgi:ribosome-associated protein
MQPEQLADLVVEALDDIKAFDIRAIDVRPLTTMTDFMVIATGRSDRQVRALADSVVQKARAAGVRPLGVEGENSGEWVLIDLGDVIVHAMQADARDFYQLEKLWDPSNRSGRPAS